MAKGPDLSMFTKNEIKDVLNDVRNNFDIAIIGSENYFNGGAIVRTAHQFLARNIYFVDCGAFYEKATMGTHKWENIHNLSLSEFIAKTSDRTLVVSERRPGLESEDLARFVYPANPIICFGGEKTGVPQEILDLPNKKVVSIPQFGILNDLNLACAAGIVMYDWVIKNCYGK